MKSDCAPIGELRPFDRVDGIWRQTKRLIIINQLQLKLAGNFLRDAHLWTFGNYLSIVIKVDSELEHSLTLSLSL